MTQTPHGPEPAPYPLEIDVHEANALIQRGEDLLLIDVRQPG